MPIDKSGLLDFLREAGSELGGRITLVAVGGTAMTLLGIKPSTRDIDFTGPKADIAAFESALKKLPHGFKVDTWPDGQVFSSFLPPDYLDISIPIRVKLKNIELRALNPLDIVATKIGRMWERDLEDIEGCVKEFRLKKRDVKKRALQLEVAGSETNYRAQLKQVLRQFFQ